MNELLHDHPAPEELAAFAAGELSAERVAAVEAHLLACPHCCEVLERSPSDRLTELQRQRSQAGQGTANSASALNETLLPETPGQPTHVGTDVGPEELANHPRYRVLAKLGEGGMGVVYKAEHKLLQRLVALKVISKNLVANASAVKRFAREIRAAGQLAHPNIVRAHDAEHAGDLHFLVMEFVDGISLHQLVQERGALTVGHACAFAQQAALGLQHAFEHGMVHRDVKPHNLMLTPQGQVKILDFGLARLINPTVTGASLTDSGYFMGTPDYIAPEQARDSHKADIRADIYSLGCTLYFLLTGRPPFAEGTVVQKLAAHVKRVPAALDELRDDVPPELALVVARMLAKDPANRYQTPAEVAQALAPFVAAQEALWQQSTDLPPVQIHVARKRTAVPVPGKRRRWLAAAAAFLLVGVTMAGVVVYRIATDRGMLIIETNDDDVQVLITKSGKEVTILDAKTQQKIELRSGKYELELKGDPKGLKLSIDHFEMTRGEKVIVTVRLEKPAPDGGAEKADPTPNSWLDLLPLVDLEKHQISGPWQRQNDGLTVLPGQGFSRLAIPSVPDGGYEFRVQMTRLTGDGEINLILPVGKYNCMASLGRGKKGWIGLQNVKGGGFGAEFAGAFTNEKAHDVSVRVVPEGENVEIVIDLNGKNVTKWRGPMSALSQREIWRIHPNSFGLGTHNDHVVFHKAQLRMLSGSARSAYEWQKVELAAKDDWIDGLGMVSLLDHRVMGTWERKKKALFTNKDEFARVVIPVVPDGDYEVKVAFTRERSGGQEGDLILPVGNTSCMLAFGRRDWLGIHEVRQNPMDARKDHDADTFQDGKKYEIHVKVLLKDDEADVSASLDGKLQFRWKGPISALVPREDWRLHPTSLGIGAHDDTMVFHSAEVRGLSGKLYHLQKIDKEIREFTGHMGEVYGVAFAPDGDRAYSGSSDKTVCEWDVNTGKEIRRFQAGVGVFSIAVTPNGKKLAAGGDGSVRIWDLSEKTPQPDVLSPDVGGALPVAFFPNSTMLASGARNASVRLWDLRTGKPQQGALLDKHSGQVLTLAVSPDGKWLACGGYGRKASLWDVSGDIPVLGPTLVGPPGIVEALAFSPDGTILATASSQGGQWNLPGFVQLWNPKTGDLFGSFQAHDGMTRSLVFTNNGKMLVTASADQKIKLWHVMEGKATLSTTFVGHAGIIWSMALSRDGRHLLSGSRDRTARLWRLPDWD